ncbi:PLASMODESMATA CALLOSE-BINDING PROTEIN 5 [Elaeis guineensis]|uniref:PLASMODESMATA CALLOSE-BINDING PROTEIN 5 n=1 Tax=Elaeis guineensis var. tenera TaxID=51953 RepID=A0A6I9QV11_ELAGV|nr:PLASMODESMATA CALLOSE-BINDING PROTEIN 5 [Elaeis guineensis]XP_019704475.1 PLASMODESMATA CALLOSE-BINDING PROTEIN 5 [Elaeis guineensis]
MARVVLFLLFLLLSFSSGWAGGVTPPLRRRRRAEEDGGGRRKDDEGPAVATTGKLWCVAKNNAEDGALQSALDWACGPGGADCRPIQEGGACYEPQDIQSHASFAFNDYFVHNGFSSSACDFSGTAALTSLNPSHDRCIFPSSSSTRNGNFSGSTTGSIAGLGPAGADISGGHLLLVQTWMQPSGMAIFVILTVATTGTLFR